MEKEILPKLLDFITCTFQVEKDEINLENSLIDEGIIDSFGLIEIADFISDEFGLSIEEDEMNTENFGSVIKIVAFISKKIGAAGPSSVDSEQKHASGMN